MVRCSGDEKPLVKTELEAEVPIASWAGRCRRAGVRGEEWGDALCFSHLLGGGCKNPANIIWKRFKWNI